MFAISRSPIVGLAAAALAALITAPALAQTQIAPSGGGSAGVLSQNTNVGQSFTVPAGETNVRDFSLGLYGGGGGAVTFNLELYAFTGGVVGTRIAMGGPFVASPDSQNVVQTRVTPTGGATVTAGAAYLILATRISGGRAAMPVQSNVYAGGFAYENNNAFGSVDAFFVVNLGPPPPAVTGLSPAGGPTTGGTSVVITGTTLGSATGVTFGGVAGAITNNTATSITVTSPARGAGNADVIVTTANGSSPNTASDNFTYFAPVPVPTLTEWAMILLGLTLAGGAAFQLRHRQALARERN